MNDKIEELEENVHIMKRTEALKGKLQDKTMLDEWQEFRAITIPPDYPEPIVTQLKRAFYVGALNVLILSMAKETSEDRAKLLGEVRDYIKTIS